VYLYRTKREKFNKRNIGIIFLSMITVLVANCSVEPMDVVKEGTLNFDESVTVGAALDGYSYFSESSWKTFNSSQGRTIVEFSGTMANYAYHGVTHQGVTLSEEMVKKAEKIVKGLKTIYTCQFQISESEETFDVIYSGINITGYNRVEEVEMDEEARDEEWSMLKNIYRNEAEETTWATYLVLTQIY